MWFRSTSAQLDHAIRPALGQEGRQIDAHLAQHGEMFTLLDVGAAADLLLEFRLQAILLACRNLHRLALAQLCFLTLARHLQFMAHFGRLLGAALAGAGDLAIELVVLQVLRLLFRRAMHEEFR